MSIGDDVDKKSEKGKIIDADETGAVEKLLIVQQGDLSLHFLDSFCDRHKFFFRFGVLVVNAYAQNVTGGYRKNSNS